MTVTPHFLEWKGVVELNFRRRQIESHFLGHFGPLNGWQNSCKLSSSERFIFVYVILLLWIFTKIVIPLGSKLIFRLYISVYAEMKRSVFLTKKLLPKVRRMRVDMKLHPLTFEISLRKLVILLQVKWNTFFYCTSLGKDSCNLI